MIETVYALTQTHADNVNDKRLSIRLPYYSQSKSFLLFIYCMVVIDFKAILLSIIISTLLLSIGSGASDSVTLRKVVITHKL